MKEIQEYKSRYDRASLELMTTFHLREICRREKIMNGLIGPPEKEPLIRAILRSRGRQEEKLIRRPEKEGKERLEQFFSHCRVEMREDSDLQCAGRITAYRGLAIECHDSYTVPYRKELAGTNAILVGHGMQICAVFTLEERTGDKQNLYLTKDARQEVWEAGRRDYRLLCADRRTSELLYDIYYGKSAVRPVYIEVYSISLIDFSVREPVTLTLPLAIDFGSSGTVAGVWLDASYFAQMGTEAAKGLKEEAVNYTLFPDGAGESILLPSVVGVYEVTKDDYTLVFGHDALQLAGASYIDEGFCIFYDIKRWAGEYKREEEIADRDGRRRLVKRVEILRHFLLYVIRKTEDRFKCRITQVHLSGPVRQRRLFGRMFEAALPDYDVNGEVMLDEGMAVLYNTVSDMTQRHAFEENEEYEALIIDCGGGTTDLCSYRFRIRDRQAAYRISMEASYENGDTDFGGDNLTYRIMQAVKISLLHACGSRNMNGIREILEQMDVDRYRFIDAYGTEEYYRPLQEAYEKAEEALPTRFAAYEHFDRKDYYRVKNNFHTLFSAAEAVKKQFYQGTGTLSVTVSVKQDTGKENIIYLDPWKLSFKGEGKLGIRREIPEITLTHFEMQILLGGEIYGMIRRFMEGMYREGRLQDFSLIRLTGQSCRIGLFRDALKEFVPGRMIQYRKKEEGTNVRELKTACVEGALKYIRDRRYGFADMDLQTGKVVLPYVVSAYSHTGKEVILTGGKGSWEQAGHVSRNMEEVTLEILLKNRKGEELHRFCYMCRGEDFEKKQYEEIRDRYAGHIQQKETDGIENGEVRFFVWAEQEDWGFLVVPVCCREDELYLGREAFYCFESGGWMNSFYDGRK